MLFPAISTAERTCCRSAPGEVGTVAQFAGEGESQGGDPRPCRARHIEFRHHDRTRIKAGVPDGVDAVDGARHRDARVGFRGRHRQYWSDLLVAARSDAGADQRGHEVADDKNALDERQRADMTAQITADELLIQRAECSLIWHAEAQGEIIDFRADTSPLALLGIQLRTAPAINPSPGTSRDHGYDVVYGRRG